MDQTRDSHYYVNGEHCAIGVGSGSGPAFLRNSMVSETGECEAVIAGRRVTITLYQWVQRRSEAVGIAEMAAAHFAVISAFLFEWWLCARPSLNCSPMLLRDLQIFPPACSGQSRSRLLRARADYSRSRRTRSPPQAPAAEPAASAPAAEPAVRMRSCQAARRTSHARCCSRQQRRPHAHCQCSARFPGLRVDVAAVRRSRGALRDLGRAERSSRRAQRRAVTLDRDESQAARRARAVDVPAAHRLERHGASLRRAAMSGCTP